MRRVAALTCFALLAVALLFVFLSRPQGLNGRILPDHQPDLVNGKKLLYAGGCPSCHEPDLAGGLQLASAFGRFRVPNITPDPKTGIGGWSVTDFINAMRGLTPDGRHYYPAFPYPSYLRMTVADLMDLKAYLDTFEPVENRVAGHDLHFPWNIRRGIGLWKRSYLQPGPVVPLDEGREGVARGRYLVEGPGHCGECHTPRDRFGGPIITRWLAGGRHPEGEGRVPNITPHPDGLADWSEKDIAYYLESGFTPDYDMVGGTMVKVQEHLARLPASDLAAIAAYLKAVPPVADEAD
jgi:mono/diheme cytochrome c family protein